MVDYAVTDTYEAEELERKRDRERLQEIHDLKTILNIPAGERFFKRLFKSMESISSMTGNSWTFFNEGKRSYAKNIWLDVVEANAPIASKIAMEVYIESKREN